MRVLLLYFTIIGLVCAVPSVLILARGGSKGVRLKNLETVGGVSLVARAIKTAMLAGLNVTVSTDHPLIALEAVRNGARILRRSKVTATDWAPSIWGAAEFAALNPEIETLLLLQATSPFIHAEHLRSSVNKIKHFDCVFSVTRSYKLRWQDNNGAIKPINFMLNLRPRRQDWTGELLETGAFYLTRRHLIESGLLQNNNSCTLESTPMSVMFKVGKSSSEDCNRLFSRAAAKSKSQISKYSFDKRIATVKSCAFGTGKLQ